MGEVSVTVNGRAYEISCDDGQEQHVRRLATYVDQKVGELVNAVGQVGDARLLLMASLLIADELSEAHGELAAIRAAGNGQGLVATPLHDERLRSDIETLARRIEDIADRLKPA